MSASISTSVAPVGFDSFYEQIKDQPTFIVLGAQGSGTNLLSRILTRALNFSVTKDRSLIFNAAANVAMRDVGAQLAIRFGRQRSVQDLIAQKNGISAPTGSLVSETSVENAEQIVDQASRVIEDDVLASPDERIPAEQTDDEDIGLGAVQEDLAKDVESVVEETQQDLQIEDVEQAPSEER